MIVAAVDPGLTGALAFGLFRKIGERDQPWVLSQVLDVRDMPVRTIGESRKPYSRAIRELCEEFSVDMAIMEWPETSAGAHGEGPTTSAREFSFGAGCGTTLAALQLLSEGPSVLLAEPRVWKAALQLGSDKSTSIERAAKLLGPRSYLLGKPASHDRAEAVLLLRYLELIVLPRGRLTLI